MDHAVIDAVLAIARRKDPSLQSAGPEQSLGALGFDSLDLAQLVAELEASLGVDPFATQAISNIRTVGDLCVAYRSAAGGGAR